jgi:hypothetical protein
MLKNILVILLISSIILPQKTYTFTEEEVLELYASITELQHSDSLNNEIIITLEDQLNLYESYIQNDSTIISNLEYQLELKDELIEVITPKWYEHKYLWFGYGISAILIPTWAIGQIK